MFESIEKLKQEFTDKYVEVAPGIPELARFEGHVGQVKTVNMSGRALVQFDAWANIGWYDIELDYLKVVPKPEPQAAAPKPAKAPSKPAAKAPPAAAGGKKLSPLEMARMQGAAKSAAPAGSEKAAPSGGAKKSTADILAAARAAKSDAPKAPSAEAAAPASAPTAAAAQVEQAEPEPQTAAPEPQQAAAKAAAPAFAKGERPSVAEILAWCREHDAK